MFRIGPFSKLARVSARMLRHYEKCGLFHPAEVDCENGYRLYSAEQIPLINRIVCLRDMGFTAQEIGFILDNSDNAAYLEEMLKQKSSAIHAAIAGERQKLALLQRALREMKENQIMKNYDITIKKLEPVQVLSLRETIPSYSDEGDLWHKMYRLLSKNALPMAVSSGSIYSIYHDFDYKEKDVDVEICVPWDGDATRVEGLTCRALEEVPVAVCVVSDGPYENIAAANAYAATWIQENGYEIIGNSRGMGIRHPGNERDPDSFCTEVQFPARKI